MLHGKLILVIEDDAGIRRGVVDALQSVGYRTADADDGRKGLELAITSEWDLLLLDLMLPNVEGDENVNAGSAQARDEAAVPAGGQWGSSVESDEHKRRQEILRKHVPDGESPMEGRGGSDSAPSWSERSRGLATLANSS